MSYLTQMLGLTVQNFVSAATGMAILVAFIRGFAAPQRPDHRQLLGGPDPHHAVHPAAACSLVLAIVLVSQGVVQTFGRLSDGVLWCSQPLTSSPRLDAAGNPVKDAAGNPVMDTLAA